MEKAALFLIGVLIGPYVHAQLRPDAAPPEVIVSTAPEATIYVDDVSQGEADAKGHFVLRGLKEGPHVLRVKLHGKKPFTRKIVVAVGKPARVQAALIDDTGDLEVYTAPQAEVLLDGKSVGVADGSGRLLVPKVAAVNHRLRATLAGHQAMEREIDVVSDMLNSVTLALKPIEAFAEKPADGPPEYIIQRRLVDRNGITRPFFLPDGNLAAEAVNRRVIIWDPNTGRELRKIVIRPGVELLDVSRNLKWAAVRDFNGVVLLVDTESGDVVHKFGGYLAAFAPDSKRVMIGEWPDKNTAIVYEVEDGKALQTWKDPEIGLFVHSPDGRSAATSSENGVTIWDAGSGRTLRRLATGRRPRSVCFSTDGRWLAVLHTKTIELWEYATGRRGPTIETGGSDSREIEGGAFASDSYLVTTTGDCVQVWDISTGREVRRWPLDHSRYFGGISFSADGKWMAITREDLLLWERQ